MIRLFQEGDITAIKEIYNQGVMTKRATLETSEKMKQISAIGY